MSLGLNVDLTLSPILILVLISLFIYTLWTPFTRLITPDGVAGIPSLPNPAPLIGDLPWITAKKKANPSVRLMDEISKELGPISQIRITFLRTMVIVMDYQEIESILGSRSSEFDRDAGTTEMFRPLLPTGQISQKTGTMWKHHRRIIGPAMTSKYLSLTTPRANESVRELIELFRVKADLAGDRSFVSEGDMESSTMDAICGMAFGASWGIINAARDQVRAMSSAPTGALGEAVFSTTRPEIAQATWYLFESLPLTSLLPSLSHFFTSLSPTYRRHDRHVRSWLQARLEESRKKTNLIGAEAAVELADNTLDMMVARENKAEDWMPDNEMVDEILQYLTAGTETSGVALTWWLKYMTNNPAIQRKLRDHILSRMPELQDRQPTFEDLNATNLPYLEAVVHETLRLSRTAGAVLREAKQDCVILGHRVPKGTTLFLSTALGTEDASDPTAGPHPASYLSEPISSAESPDKLVQQSEILASRRSESANKRKVGYWEAGTGHVFDPERWLNVNGELDLSSGPSLPFSLGQRGCFGKNLAMLELRLFISQLNLAFFFGKIRDDQNSMDIHETVATHPVQSYIRPLSWDSMEARAYYLAK